MPESKLSNEFENRVRALGPDKTIRAIVMLGTPVEPLSGERQDRIAKVRDAAQNAVAQIDQILGETGGRRLGSEPSALGYITVEATAPGIRALAQSEHVRAILEDQGISPIP